jgi:LacI family transcriptional regulator
MYMSTIRDVAKRAGVSAITVSRVINNDGYVSAETRRRVEAAIAELDYIPNALGPSLRSKRTQTLALVLSDMTNPFWTTVARGVEDAANMHGYHMIIGNTDKSPAKQEEYLMFLLKKQVDGFLLVPASERSIDTLQKRHTPFVVLDRRIPNAKIDTVRGDSEGGAYQIIRHLLELGHKRIAVVTGPPDVSTARDRVEGYLRALEEAGIKDDQQVYWGEYTQQSGSELTKQALSRTPRPTAIFAANNFIAIGIMRALKAAGLNVPEDISVVAFDDLPAAITIDPFFTVAAQPAYEMGQQATMLLLSRLAGNAQDDPREVVLPTEIIVRKSSGRPPNEHR